MPSIASGGPRSETSARVIHVVADRAGSSPAGVDAIEDPSAVTGVVYDGDPSGVGRMAAALLVGRTELHSTDAAAAVRVRAVVDRLLQARAEL